MNFTIFEALFILAIDDGDGDLVESMVNDLEPALAAGVLAELVLRKRIRLEDGRVTVVDPSATENPILDRALYAMVETGRMRKIKYWINTLTYEKLRGEIGQELVENGVLLRKKKRLLLAVPFGEHPAGDASAKFGLKNRLREIVLAGQAPEAPELIQLVLLNNCGLLGLVFTRGERKSAGKKIMKLSNEGEAGLALSETLQQLIAVATRSVS
ncbi:MAG: GPP34 family phosphoprotein [Anaerolineaceae bacterium]|nr:GPP34 family phosphoprotein [Anaerolineaceae bacterium]